MQDQHTPITVDVFSGYPQSLCHLSYQVKVEANEFLLMLESWSFSIINTTTQQLPTVTEEGN